MRVVYEEKYRTVIVGKITKLIGFDSKRKAT
jgi:hypothetical protein